MKISIRTLWFAVFVFALVSSTSSAQQRRWQSAPPQNGGPAVLQHHPAANGQKKIDPDQSRYTWIELDPNNTGVGYCYADAHALNDSDQVVVNWSDPNDCNILHASLWDHGKWKTQLLDYPVDPNCAEPTTYLTSITSWGFAFGSYWSFCPYQPAGGVNVKNGQWYFLPDISGYPINQGFSMSDNGLAVGVDSDADYTVFHHWVWDRSKYIFPTFPDNWEVDTWWAGPLFINNHGQIAGEYFDTTAGYERAYLQEGSKVTVLDQPGNPDGGTYVNGVNNEGYALVCGGYDEGPYYPSASFLYKQGKYTQLPTPPFEGMTLWFIFNVNDRGDMIGRFWDGKSNGMNDPLGNIHVFIAVRK